MELHLSILDTSGHKTVVFDLSTTEGGPKLELEIEELIQGGHTVFVLFPGNDAMLPVVSYQAEHNAWVTRSGVNQLPLTVSTRAVATKPIVGG